MGFRFQTSTGAIMLLVIVFALELVLFQEVGAVASVYGATAATS